jgi:hypothetical protein
LRRECLVIQPSERCNVVEENRRWVNKMMGFSKKGYKNEVKLGRAFITIPKCASAGKEIMASGGI